MTEPVSAALITACIVGLAFVACRLVLHPRPARPVGASHLAASWWMREHGSVGWRPLDVVAYLVLPGGVALAFCVGVWLLAARDYVAGVCGCP